MILETCVNHAKITIFNIQLMGDYMKFKDNWYSYLLIIFGIFFIIMHFLYNRPVEDSIYIYLIIISQLYVKYKKEKKEKNGE